jgi:hypothetical protein
MHKELVDYNKRLVILMGKLNRLHQALRKGKGILIILIKDLEAIATMID